MRILHTADWHIGQTFFDYDRREEHLHFLNWLKTSLKDNNIDVLLVSGDVFDGGNPSAESLQLFYSFLSKSIRENPGLQIIVTAGNHDSGHRLESPRPLLESEEFPVQAIHLIGTVSRKDGRIQYDKLCIPLYSKDGIQKAWCLAVPFLRQGETPELPEGTSGYAASVGLFYREALQNLQERNPGNLPVLAMGHLHVSQAAVSDMDSNERTIIGGVEGVPVSAFPEEFSYVALGHIHKAQILGGSEKIRYCGSPLPMSFSEKRYRHRVIVFEIQNGKAVGFQEIEFRFLSEVISIPGEARPIEEVLNALSALKPAASEGRPAPYLEVLVLEDRPDPGQKKKIQDALEGKHARLAKITPQAAGSASGPSQTPGVAFGDFKNLKPEELLKTIYLKKFKKELPAELLDYFREITSGIETTS